MADRRRGAGSMHHLRAPQLETDQWTANRREVINARGLISRLLTAPVTPRQKYLRLTSPERMEAEFPGVGVDVIERGRQSPSIHIRMKTDAGVGARNEVFCLPERREATAFFS